MKGEEIGEGMNDSEQEQELDEKNRRINRVKESELERGKSRSAGVTECSRFRKIPVVSDAETQGVQRRERAQVYLR